MSQEIISYIQIYGYFGIFILVFSQEVGLPNPIPNEFILTFSGYLVFTKVLKISFVVLTAFLADITAISILYTLFYFLGNVIFSKPRKWLPMSKEKIDIQLIKLQENGTSSIFLGRLTPFIRGYVAAMCGLIQFNTKKFTTIALSTSLIWACFYVTLGYLLGPYWDFVFQHFSQYKNYIYAFIIAFILFIIFRFIRNNKQ